MYPVSESVLKIIRGGDRSFEWLGNITLSNGTVYPFDMSNIVQSTSFVKSSCPSPCIGVTVSSELSLQMIIDVDIELLKGAVIGIDCRVISESNIDTWGNIADFSWIDVNGIAWGDEEKVLTTDIPIGVFNVDNAKRAVNSVSITAYDNMQKFSIEFPSIDTYRRNPFEWLRYICSKCGVDVGISKEQVEELPNGKRTFVFSDVNLNIKTYRDLLSQIASALCSVAMMDRHGKLTLVPCVSKSVLTITPDDRFSSEFGDYKVLYTGIYSQYKAGGIQKYLTNSEPDSDTGSIIDLGCNPFLQFSDDNIRNSAVQAIIDKFSDFLMTSASVSIPYDPTIELMDTISYTGNHTPMGCIAPIMDLTANINGDISIRSDISETSSDLLREDKNIDGVSGSSSTTGDSYASTQFWIEIASYPDTSSVSITQDTVTTSLDVEFTAKNNRTQIAWTGTYTISNDAIITAAVYFGDKLIYTVTDSQTCGEHIFNITTGYEINEKGKYNIGVVIGISTGATLTFQKETARLTVLGTGWDDYSIDSGEGLTQTAEILRDISDLMGYEYSEDVDWDKLSEDLDIDISDADLCDNKYISEDVLNQVVKKLDNYPNTKHRSHDIGYDTKDYGDKTYVNTQQNGDTTYPYAFEITTKPTKLSYDTGETIDLSGAIIIARTVAWDVWISEDYPDGRVPLDEIIISPTVAE